MAVQALVVTAVAVLCYTSALSGELIFDDEAAITENRDVTDADAVPLRALLEHDFWGEPMASATSHKSWRPLTTLTFRLNHAAHGLAPLGYNAVNVALHALASVLVLAACSTVARAPRVPLLAALLFAAHPVHTEAVAGKVGRADILAACFSLLSYLAHRRAMSCGGADGRLLGLLLPCLLASAVCAALAMLSKETGLAVLGINVAVDVGAALVAAAHPCGAAAVSSAPAERSAPSAAASIAASAAASAAAAATATTAAAETPATAGGAQLRRRGPMAAKAEGGAPSAKGRAAAPATRPSLLLLVLRVAAAAAAAVGLLWFRLRQNHGTPPTFPYHANPLAHVTRAAPNPTVARVLSIQHVWALHAWLLLCPRWLCCDWSAGTVPPVLSVLDARNAGTIAMWTAIAAAVRGAIVRDCRPGARGGGEDEGDDDNDDDERPAYWLALLLLGAPFLPASGLLFDVGFVVAERVLYLPSAGFCLLLALAASRAAGGLGGGGGGRGAHSGSPHNGSARRSAVLGCCALVLCLYGAKTHTRNGDWRTSRSLFASAAALNPGNSKAWTFLSTTYAADPPTRERYLRKAVALEQGAWAQGSVWADPFVDLGCVLHEQAEASATTTAQDEHRVAEARHFFKAAIRLENADSDANFRYGRFLQRADGDAAGARKHYELALKTDPKMHLALNDLGNLLRRSGGGSAAATAEAEALYRRAIATAPANAQYHANLGALLASRGRLADASGPLLRAVALAPQKANYVRMAADVTLDSSALPASRALWEQLGALEEAAAKQGHSARAVDSIVGIARWHEARGDVAAAERGFRSALAANPHDAEAQHAWKVFAHTQRKKQHAEKRQKQGGQPKRQQKQEREKQPKPRSQQPERKKQHTPLIEDGIDMSEL
jgi:tetratricopeptide (TPR) repeat protein